MKYRLKDSSSWGALKIASPDFEKEFQESCAEQWDDDSDFILVWFLCKLRINIAKEDIERYDDYNPHKWNKFPEVTPPENVRMRLEIAQHSTTTDIFVYRCAAQFKCGEWVDGSDDKIFLGKGDEVRFRPWVDPDEEREE